MNFNQNHHVGQFLITYLLMLLVTMLALMLLDLSLGSYPVSLSNLVGHHTLAQTVFWQLRLPHLLALCCVGMALGVAGCVIQSLFQNPLADPAILGISSGSSLAVVGGMVITSMLGVVLWPWVMSLLAMTGAAVVMLLMMALSVLTKRFGVAGLILMGVALNAVLGSAISLLFVFANHYLLSEALMWTLGSVSMVAYPVLLTAMGIFLFGLVLLLPQLGKLDRLTMGEQQAYLLGVNLPRLKMYLLMALTLLIGSSVMLCGPLAFVGLLAPHVARVFCRPRHSHMVIVSALVGTIWLLLADVVTKFFSPTAIPLGVVTALIGGPFFLLLLIRLGRRQAC